MMLSAGEPLTWVSRQLGHSSVVTTAQVYARWIPDSMPEVGNRAVAIFGQAAGQN
jgi:integrase